jgi:hypothetical protein
MVGFMAGYNNRGTYNVLIGDQAGYSNQANYNVFIGPQGPGSNNTTGSDNIMIGNRAGVTNSTGGENVFMGGASGLNSNGNGNTYLGSMSGTSNKTGSNNVFIGYGTGWSNINGSNNVLVGFQAGSNETGSNKLYIANSSTNPPLIYGDFSTGTVALGTITPATSYKLYVNGSAFATGTWSSSDVRWKKNITPLTDVLGKLLNLKGVNYEWRKTEFPEISFESGKQIGLIAQDVEKTFPELVKTDGNGYKAVSYEKLSVILLEGIKEQQKEIDDLKTLVNSLIANQTAQVNK